MLLNVSVFIQKQNKNKQDKVVKYYKLIYLVILHRYTVHLSSSELDIA